jgi:hypothetical protein
MRVAELDGRDGMGGYGPGGFTVVKILLQLLNVMY